IPREHGQPDARLASGDSREIPAPIIDVGLVADILVALPVNEAARIPLAVAASGNENMIGDRLAKVDAVVADEKPEIHPPLARDDCAMPEAIKPDEHVTAVPDRSRLVRFLERLADAAIAVALERKRFFPRPVHEVA